MKLKKSLFASLLATGLIAGVLGTAHADSLRFASEAPRSDTQFIGAERFNELLKAKTNGALELKIYPDSSLGNAQPAISGARGGTIDIVISGASNYTGIVPLIGVFQ